MLFYFRLFLGILGLSTLSYFKCFEIIIDYPNLGYSKLSLVI
jgi:hypothetical protein